MGMFDFLKKRKREEEKTEINQEVKIPEQETSGKMLAELPEFPTMAEQDISPLPKLELLSDLEKSEISIPSLGETSFEKPVIHPDKDIMLKFDDFRKKVEEQGIEREIELPHEAGEEFEGLSTKEDFEPAIGLKEEPEKKFMAKKIKTAEKRAFSPKKPVFVNVKSYQGISDEISVITAILENSEEVISRLNSIKVRENNELKKMHDSLDGLNKKIILVDDILSKG